MAITTDIVKQVIRFWLLAFGLLTICIVTFHYALTIHPFLEWFHVDENVQLNWSFINNNHNLWLSMCSYIWNDKRWIFYSDWIYFSYLGLASLILCLSNKKRFVAFHLSHEKVNFFDFMLVKLEWKFIPNHTLLLCFTNETNPARKKHCLLLLKHHVNC